MLEAIQTTRKTGNEVFVNGSDVCSLHDYWAWAHSDIMGNAERGKIAEYIVAMALNKHRDTRSEWDSYDILSENGIKIEVKSSAYLQTWAQKSYSLLTFGIRPTQAWSQSDNSYQQTKKRQADVYVFCVVNCKDQDTVNPLDLNQWDFYVLRTSVLNDMVPNQKTISLAGVLNLGARKTSFSGLRLAIHAEFDA